MAINNIIRRKDPMKNPTMIDIAIKLGKVLLNNNKYDLAYYLNLKLYQSGLRNIEWMLDWITFSPDKYPTEFLITDLSSLAPNKPEVIMLLSENFLKTGEISKAIKMIENGISSNPDSKELQNTYILIKNKFKKAL